MSPPKNQFLSTVLSADLPGSRPRDNLHVCIVRIASSCSCFLPSLLAIFKFLLHIGDLLHSTFLLFSSHLKYARDAALSKKFCFVMPDYGRPFTATHST